MYLGDLQTKDVVSIIDGKNLGRITDVEIDENGYIKNIIVQKKRFFINLFKSNYEYSFMYKDIDKIGDDVILIKTQL